ncbi:MAG: hypothetical protein Q4B68_05780 [Bacteroidales bacterium]|nr:hypothetical protein [Bacteroidales bacterium]
MKKITLIGLGAAMAMTAQAGGMLTNTNQNVAFNRMMSREASIGIDGVYSNPAGVAFLPEGAHLSINWQAAFQSRTIKNEYAPFAYNTSNPTAEREFKGKASAPVIPSVQFAYNIKDWSFQANLAIGGGGGKCEFENGLGSFERIVANTALAVNKLAAGIDGASQQMAALGIKDPGLSKVFNSPAYSYESYMRGSQYFWNFSLAAAYKVNQNLAVAAGLRGVLATANYYGYVKNITVSGMPLSMVIDKTKPNSANIELNCDQNGLGFTPYIGVDFKTGRFNFAAKYEFKTRMRLKNKSVNVAPSIGNLPQVLAVDYGVELLNPNLVQKYEGTPYKEIVAGAQQTLLANMKQFGETFDEGLEHSLGEYKDGTKIANDIPAYLALGAGYKATDKLGVNVGFHYFFDKQATSYGNREKLLKRGTIELNAGVEYNASKLVTLSAGWQNTSYGLTDAYMEDKSFVVGSNSVGLGACFHASKKVDVNVAYFSTFYNHKKVTETDVNTGLEYKSDYTRANNVLGVGIDFHF